MFSSIAASITLWHQSLSQDLWTRKTWPDSFGLHHWVTWSRNLYWRMLNKVCICSEASMTRTLQLMISTGLFLTTRPTKRLLTRRWASIKARTSLNANYWPGESWLKAVGQLQEPSTRQRFSKTSWWSMQAGTMAYFLWSRMWLSTICISMTVSWIDGLLSRSMAIYQVPGGATGLLRTTTKLSYLEAWTWAHIVSLYCMTSILVSSQFTPVIPRFNSFLH